MTDKREKIASAGSVYRGRAYRARKKGLIPDIEYHEGVSAALTAAGLGGR